MDILVTAGMGDRLREKLGNVGVHVIVTQETAPDGLIKSQARQSSLAVN